MFDKVILKILPPSLIRCFFDSASSFAASAAFTISIDAFSTCNENMIEIAEFLHITKTNHTITYNEHLRVEPVILNNHQEI